MPRHYCNKFRECENRWILKSGTFCQSRWGLASHVRYEADQLANMIQKRAGQDEHDGASDRLAGEYRDATAFAKENPGAAVAIRFGSGLLAGLGIALLMHRPQVLFSQAWPQTTRCKAAGHQEVLGNLSRFVCNRPRRAETQCGRSVARRAAVGIRQCRSSRERDSTENGFRRIRESSPSPGWLNSNCPLLHSEQSSCRNCVLALHVHLLQHGDATLDKVTVYNFCETRRPQ